MISRRAFSLFSSLLLCFSCLLFTPLARADGGKQALATEELVVSSDHKDHHFTVEVAATKPQRARGLMFREEMAPDHGMLFIFDGEGDRYFWMKNTPLPLDIIFISASGKIVSIADNATPFSEDTIPSGKPARYVLEVNAGTAKELGLDEGDTVSSPSMKVD